jgi:hypothetical protein
MSDRTENVWMRLSDRTENAWLQSELSQVTGEFTLFADAARNGDANGWRAENLARRLAKSVHEVVGDRGAMALAWHLVIEARRGLEVSGFASDNPDCHDSLLMALLNLDDAAHEVSWGKEVANER